MTPNKWLQLQIYCENTILKKWLVVRCADNMQKKYAPTGNRTRDSTVAGSYSTTKPPVREMASVTKYLNLLGHGHLTPGYKDQCGKDINCWLLLLAHRLLLRRVLGDIQYCAAWPENFVPDPSGFTDTENMHSLIIFSLCSLLHRSISVKLLIENILVNSPLADVICFGFFTCINTMGTGCNNDLVNYTAQHSLHLWSAGDYCINSVSFETNPKAHKNGL